MFRIINFFENIYREKRKKYNFTFYGNSLRYILYLNDYLTLDINSILNFKNYYSLSSFTLLKLFCNRYSKNFILLKVEIKNLRKRLYAVYKHNSLKDFKNNIVNKSIYEINKKTDIHLTSY